MINPIILRQAYDGLFTPTAALQRVDFAVFGNDPLAGSGQRLHRLFRPPTACRRAPQNFRTRRMNGGNKIIERGDRSRRIFDQKSTNPRQGILKRRAVNGRSAMTGQDHKTSTHNHRVMGLDRESRGIGA